MPEWITVSIVAIAFAAFIFVLDRELKKSFERDRNFLIKETVESMRRQKNEH